MSGSEAAGRRARLAHSSTFLPLAGPMPVSTTSAASLPRMMPMFGTSGMRWSAMTKTPEAISLIAVGSTRGAEARCSEHHSLPSLLLEPRASLMVEHHLLGKPVPLFRIMLQACAIGHFKLKTSRSINPRRDIRTSRFMSDALLALHFQNDICHPARAHSVFAGSQHRATRRIFSKPASVRWTRRGAPAGRSPICISSSPRTIPICCAIAACS